MHRPTPCSDLVSCRRDEWRWTTALGLVGSIPNADAPHVDQYGRESNQRCAIVSHVCLRPGLDRYAHIDAHRSRPRHGWRRGRSLVVCGDAGLADRPVRRSVEHCRRSRCAAVSEPGVRDPPGASRWKHQVHPYRPFVQSLHESKNGSTHRNQSATFVLCLRLDS